MSTCKCILHTSKQHCSSHSEDGALWGGKAGQLVVVVHSILEEERNLNIQHLQMYMCKYTCIHMYKNAPEYIYKTGQPTLLRIAINCERGIIVSHLSSH